MKKSKRVLIAAPLAALIVLAGGAGAYASHYRDRALPGSEVAGVSVSGLTRAEVAAQIRDRAEKTRVTLRAGDTTRTASLSDLGYRVNVEATVDKVFGLHDQWTSYASALVSPHTESAVVVEDPQALERAVSSLVADGGTKAVNAAVTLPAGGERFVVTPDVPGTAVDPESFQAVVRKAASGLTSGTATVRFVTGRAAVTAAMAQQAADRANALVAAPVTISAGAKTFEATSSEKASWITIPTSDGVPGAPTVDAAAVEAWVRSKADSVAVAAVAGARTLSASSGEVLRVTTQAKDGAEVTNTAQVAQAVVAGLGAGTAANATFETKTVPATWTEKRVATGAENLAYPAAAGEKWVDVNLSNHTMTAYEGSRAVIGPVSMVNGAEATPTVTGTFSIYLKYATQTMRGANADGSSYESPDVPWVAYFHGGYALHGAPWRDSFGYTGSHGCVNLPVPTAKQVYDWAPVGTVVVSHN
ncbi:MAG: L,D-transpeptidase family protein [Tetrasphaera sp.]|nr:L,D-transpeptidase family protein [Tetrasphaera sp.]